MLWSIYHHVTMYYVLLCYYVLCTIIVIHHLCISNILYFHFVQNHFFMVDKRIAQVYL